MKERIDLRGDPTDPVTALWCEPNETLIDVRAAFRDRRRCTMGSAFANLIVPGEYVSREHCVLYFQEQRLFVKCAGAKNRTLVNGVPLKQKSGYVELVPGSVLTLGNTEFLVCGRAGQEQEAYVVPPMWRLLLRAMRLFGVDARAAARMGVKPRTWSDWKRHKFAEPEST